MGGCHMHPIEVFELANLNTAIAILRQHDHVDSRLDRLSALYRQENKSHAVQKSAPSQSNVGEERAVH